MKRHDLTKRPSAVGVPFDTNSSGDPRPALPIPPLLKPDADGRIRLKIQKGQTQWLGKPTETWGYNGALLGPALSLERGQKIRLEVENTLGEDTAVHWHGLEIPGIVDGGPQAPIPPGAAWKPELLIDQPAATCWFHPHPHAKTGRHVTMGLAGLLLINDEHSARLPLPRDWGVNDIPVILQDRRLSADGQIEYAMDIVSAAVGWFGNTMMTNGSLYPQHAAPRGWLRLLNGCNARSLRIATSDGRPLYVIAGDGGFLPEPMKLTELPLFMGERFEVLVDCGDGKPFDLLTLPVRQMGMSLPPFDEPLPVLRIQPTGDKGHGTLPDQLVALAPLPKLEGLPTRTLKLSMDPRLDQQGMEQLMKLHGHEAMAGFSMDAHSAHAQSPAGGHGAMHMPAPHQAMDHSSMHKQAMDHGSMHMAAPEQPYGPLDLWRGNVINGQAFMMDVPMFDVKKGRYERWVISGEGDMMLHPFHIHGTRFRILSENGKPPQAHRSGFKDIVHVEGKQSEVLVRFDHPAPKEHAFMAHCHVLEHEDTGMMLSFTVTE